jgi:hypothetical protein
MAARRRDARETFIIPLWRDERISGISPWGYIGVKAGR